MGSHDIWSQICCLVNHSFQQLSRVTLSLSKHLCPLAESWEAEVLQIRKCFYLLLPGKVQVSSFPPDLFQMTLHGRETKAVIRNSNKRAFRKEWQEKEMQKGKTERTWWCCDIKGHGTRMQSRKYCLDKSKPASPTKTSRLMYQLIPFVCLFSAVHHYKLHICFAGSYIPTWSQMSIPVTVSNYGQGWGGMRISIKINKARGKPKMHFWAVTLQSTALSGTAKSTSTRICMGAPLRQLHCVWPETATTTSAPFGLITANLFLHREKGTTTHHFNLCLSRECWSYQMRSAEVTSSHWRTLFLAMCFHCFSVSPPLFTWPLLRYLNSSV